MPSGSPVPAAVMAHNPGVFGPVKASGVSLRLARVLGLPPANVPMTRTGTLPPRQGRQSVKCVSLRRSKSEGNIRTPYNTAGHGSEQYSRKQVKVALHDEPRESLPAQISKFLSSLLILRGFAANRESDSQPGDQSFGLLH